MIGIYNVIGEVLFMVCLAIGLPLIERAAYSLVYGV